MSFLLLDLLAPLVPKGIDPPTGTDTLTVETKSFIQRIKQHTKQRELEPKTENKVQNVGFIFRLNNCIFCRPFWQFGRPFIIYFFY